MELNEFKESILEQIKCDADADRTSDREEFVYYVSKVLIEAEEIADFIFLPFESLGRNGKKIQIDGYSFNELDNYLDIFISPPLSYYSDVALTNSGAEKIFSRARAFIEEAEYIEKHAEESAPGYGLAIDIQKKYKDVTKYCIYLLTDMSMSKNIKVLKSAELFGKPMEYHIWDIKRLYQIAESATGKEDIVIDIKSFGCHGLPCLPASQTNDYSAYLCNIPGNILATLYNTYGGRLLEGNVRSFLQTKGKVNKGIRTTILNSPSMFFAYNNGIAATAYGVKVEESAGTKYITEITALQIVNGGQTTASLAMSLLNDKKDGSEKKIQEIYVPMKLSIVSPEKAQELIPNISRYANSQNKVSEADLWSNHPFHIRMEEFSRRIMAPRTDGKQYGTIWYYERTNGQYRQETYKSSDAEKKRFEMHNPPKQKFDKTDLAKYMNVYQLRPDVASYGGQKSFAKFAEWASAQWIKSDTYFNDEFYKRVISLAIIFKEADTIIKSQPWYNSYKANIIAYTIAKIIFIVNTNYPEYAISYNNIWLKQKLSMAWIKQIEYTSKIIYDNLVDSSRPVENVTEWAKRESCWDLIQKTKVVLLPEFVEQLAYKDNVLEQEKDARRGRQLENKLDTIVVVANFGVDNWKYLLQWGIEHRIFTSVDVDFLKLAIDMDTGRFPSDKQCKKILCVLDKARQESFPK